MKQQLLTLLVAAGMASQAFALSPCDISASKNTVFNQKESIASAIHERDMTLSSKETVELLKRIVEAKDGSQIERAFTLTSQLMDESVAKIQAMAHEEQVLLASAQTREALASDAMAKRIQLATKDAERVISSTLVTLSSRIQQLLAEQEQIAHRIAKRYPNSLMSGDL